MLIHGGPTSVDLDRWAPDVQAYVECRLPGRDAQLPRFDRFRGGVARHAIGNIGWPEVEDVLAGLDDLIAHGWTDPDRAVIAGWSWGGYLTLLMHGMHPDRFITGVAGVPVGDYAAGTTTSRRCSRRTTGRSSGGAPSDVPELMAERSPIHTSIA